MNTRRWRLRRSTGTAQASNRSGPALNGQSEPTPREITLSPTGEAAAMSTPDLAISAVNVVELDRVRPVATADEIGRDESASSTRWALSRVAGKLGFSAAHLLAIVIGVSLAPVAGSSAAFLIGALVLAVAAGSATGSGHRSLRVSDDLGAIIISTSLATAILALARPGTAEAHHFVQAGALSAALVLFARWIGFAIRRSRRRRHIGLEPTVIVGAGQVGRAVASALLTHPEHGFQPVGFLDDPLGDGEELPLPLLGQPEKLAEVMRSLEARHVIIAFGIAREAEIVRLLRNWNWLPGNVYILPRFFELRSHQRTPDSIDLRGYPLLRLRGPARAQRFWPVKRAFDIAASGFLLALVAPALAACAAAVRWSGPGPILFRQERVGQDGRRFEILKFRTMPVNNDSDTTWNVERDNRLATTGKVLRRTHLDELPQLFNVLRGEMSIIGPRPERPFFVEQFEAEIADYESRHRVPVGITGWAQVNGLFGNTSIEERSRFDNRYIDEWSLWNDFMILLRTVPTVFRRRKKS
jgi:exopolysaccharide biosynthesis polyprenyl glycosylphosphotransferase